MDSIQTGKWFPTPVASSAARAACSSPSPALSLNLQLTVACTPAALLDTGSRAAPSYSTGSSCIGPGQAGYGPELKRFILLFSSLMVRARIKRRVPERSSCFANRKELVFFFMGFTVRASHDQCHSLSDQTVPFFPGSEWHKPEPTTYSNSIGWRTHAYSC
jgi:hypothetical protein